MGTRAFCSRGSSRGLGAWGPTPDHMEERCGVYFETAELSSKGAALGYIGLTGLVFTLIQIC